MKRNDTRSLIVNTASDLFYKKGYNLTGINEIIAKAGIAKATLYSHFKSKEDLCIAYLESKNDALKTSLQDFCKSKPKGKAQLLAVVEFLIPFYESATFNGCWCIRTVAETPVESDKIRNKIKEQKLGLLQFIERLILQNFPALKPKKAKTLTKRIYLLYETAVSESHLHNDAWPINESIDLLKLLLKKLD